MTKEQLKTRIIEIIGGPMHPELSEIKAMLIMDECERYFDGEPVIGQNVAQQFFANKFSTGVASNIPTGYSGE